MRKACQALASSRTLLQAGDIDGACNRAAHGALDATEAIAPGAVLKTHHGLIAVFSKELVLNGKVDKALGRSLSKVHDMRLLADYQGEPIEEVDAVWAIEQANIFFEAIEATFFS